MDTLKQTGISSAASNSNFLLRERNGLGLVYLGVPACLMSARLKVINR